MEHQRLSTDAYKGVRDFYPEDYAVQQYIFSTWSATAQRFGFERYDASVLEPSELYRAKGSENEEIVNEQTYTFIDRGDREVTLRPEMTPTAARLIAGRHRELIHPTRWYAIPNLFRYERPQRGRLREHWQLNCDIFGSTSPFADIEIISLATQIFTDFGATADDFEIRINNRSEMQFLYEKIGITDTATISTLTSLNDRYHKITKEEYIVGLEKILPPSQAAAVLELVTTNVTTPGLPTSQLITSLATLGIHNVKLDRSLARGFSYYTGIIFEIFDLHKDGTKRAMLGGGRYDNLTALFTDTPIPGVGFGMGDVTMREFLETHNLLPTSIKNTAATLCILPLSDEEALASEQIAQQFRARGIATTIDYSSKKIGKKISDAARKGVAYIIVCGADERTSDNFTLKHLDSESEHQGSIAELVAHLIAQG